MEKTKVAALSVVTLIILAVFFTPGYLRLKKLTQENRSLERQIAEFKAINKRLEIEQEKLINDPVYLEKVAREKLGLVKEGEVVYKVKSTQQEE